MLHPERVMQQSSRPLDPVEPCRPPRHKGCSESLDQLIGLSRRRRQPIVETLNDLCRSRTAAAIPAPLPWCRNRARAAAGRGAAAVRADGRAGRWLRMDEARQMLHRHPARRAGARSERLPAANWRIAMAGTTGAGKCRRCGLGSARNEYRAAVFALPCFQSAAARCGSTKPARTAGSATVRTIIGSSRPRISTCVRLSASGAMPAVA